MDIEIIHVPEGAGQEEVLPDIAERSLDLALGLGPIRLAGARHRAVMVQQRHQRSVVGHHTGLVLADHRSLHPVIEDFLGHTAHVREGRDMAAKDRLQVLAGNEPAPEPAAVPEYHREQPDLAHDARFVGELNRELGKIDLGLLARRGFEPALELCLFGRARQAQEVRHRGIAAVIPQLPDLAQQARAAEIRECLNALLQIVFIGLDHARPRPARAVDRRLQPTVEILPHGLPIRANLPRNRGYAQTLLLQILDQNDLPQSFHLPAPVSSSFRASGLHPAPATIPNK